MASPLPHNIMTNSVVASNDSCINYMHQINEMGISEMEYVDNREKKNVFVYLTFNGSATNPAAVTR